jgi:hypothetical protein
VAVPRRANAAQWVRIRLQFFDGRRRAWRVMRVRRGERFTRMGNGRSAVMGGATFTVSMPPAAARVKLRGLVDVQWRRGGRVVSRARVLTTRGHADADDPLLRTSLARCEISR